MAHPGSAVASPLPGPASDTSRYAVLSRWLDHQSTLQWAYGEHDCVIFAADWVRAWTNNAVDLAEGIRGTYATRDDADAVLARLGGIEGLADAKLGAAGFKRIQLPTDGDVGLIEAPLAMGGKQIIPAVRFGPLWAARAINGVRRSRFDFVRAWRVE